MLIRLAVQHMSLTKSFVANIKTFHMIKNIPRLYSTTLTNWNQEPHQQQVINEAPETLIDDTYELEIYNPDNLVKAKKFKCLKEDGKLSGPVHESLNREKLIELYEGMVKLNVFDNIMYECQRQGRISFYMTHLGEEAIQFGSAGALNNEDIIFAQYREGGILIHRKMSFQLMIDQCLGNCDDLGKGRQMPVHYGNRAINYVTISSPLATQLPQAVGAAYTLKRSGSAKDRIVICYFGEGAASEGDTHAAFNFAATLECPVIFFCRNNGYAISTPTNEQYRGDGILGRALGCGIASVRVDGNDLFAVYEATRQAKEFASTNQRPFFLEAMTYRVGHHSTSDDSSAYRIKQELDRWRLPQVDPIKKVQNYLLGEGLWSQTKEEELRKLTRDQVLESLRLAETKRKSPVSTMFDDVYDEQPLHLKQQSDSLAKHLELFGPEYPLNEYQT